MKKLLNAIAAASLALIAATPVLAAETAAVAAPAAKLTTAETSIGDLLDNPKSKEVLMKHAPALAGNAQIEMARSMTLKQIQGFAGDMLSDEVLTRIDVDLTAIK